MSSPSGKWEGKTLKLSSIAICVTLALAPVVLAGCADQQAGTPLPSRSSTQAESTAALTSTPTPAPPTTAPPAPAQPTSAPPTTNVHSTTSNCTSGYSPCLVYHGGADYDCAGGSGNGPYYTAPGVLYNVTGSDPYDLDRDGDGQGCE